MSRAVMPNALRVVAIIFLGVAIFSGFTTQMALDILVPPAPIVVLLAPIPVVVEGSVEPRVCPSEQLRGLLAPTVGRAPPSQFLFL